MYTCFFVQVSFVVNTHAFNACVSCTLVFTCRYSFTIYMDNISFPLNTIWKMKIGIEEDNGACVHLLFCQRIEWKRLQKFEQLMKKKFKWCLTGNISLGVQHSKGEVVQCRPTSQGDKCLSCRTWPLCMALPMWVSTFPRLGLLLQGSHFLILGPPLWIPYASLVDLGNEPSSTGMLVFALAWSRASSNKSKFRRN